METIEWVKSSERSKGKDSGGRPIEKSLTIVLAENLNICYSEIEGTKDGNGND
jgi:hypothetical protein